MRSGVESKKMRNERNANKTGKSSEFQWHEFPWDETPKMPPGPHKKLKIYADANIPRLVTDELRGAGLPIESA